MILIAVFAMTAGCSTLNPINNINPFKDEKGIDVTAQIGKENTRIDNRALAQVDARSDSTITSRNDIRAEKVEQVSNFKDSAWLILAFALMAGFAIPNPFNYYAHRRQIKDLREVANEREQRLRAVYERLRYADAARSSERETSENTPDNK